jgi:LysM repeat protein
MLVASLVISAMGIFALGASKLMTWAAPEPVSAATSQIEETAPPVTVYLPAEQSTDPPAEPTPIADEANNAADADPIGSVPLTETVALTPTTHTVVAGDTLAKIASERGLSVVDLIVANDIAEPDLLYVGQVLSIPMPDQSPEPENDAPLATEESPLPEVGTELGLSPREARWIDVDLSNQRLTAYEGDTAVRTTLVSTGLPGTPTPEGQYRIWIKLRYDDMAGADYYIEDVPYVMYFHEGYGLHGVTWHGNFGHPMSHGCVNLPTPEAEWLFNWADVGTLVSIRA